MTDIFISYAKKGHSQAELLARELQIKGEDTEGLIDYIRAVEGVVVAAFFEVPLADAPGAPCAATAAVASVLLVSSITSERSVAMTTCSRW